MVRILRFPTSAEPHPQALASLESQTDLPFEVYDKGLCAPKVKRAPSLSYAIAAVVSEPTEASWRDAIDWARSRDISHFLACASRSPSFQTFR